jgi:hypothetical protein
VAAVLPQPLLQSLLPPGMVVQALEHDQWLYKDPSGNQQGPFSRSDILDWAEQGGRVNTGGGGHFREWCVSAGSCDTLQFLRASTCVPLGF